MGYNFRQPNAKATQATLNTISEHRNHFTHSLSDWGAANQASAADKITLTPQSTAPAMMFSASPLPVGRSQSGSQWNMNRSLPRVPYVCQGKGFYMLPVCCTDICEHETEDAARWILGTSP